MIVKPTEPRPGPKPSLEERYDAEDGAVFLSGMQALVRVPIDQMRADRRAGLHTAGFISGYQGSPLAGYDKELERARKHLEKYGIVHQPGLNEELAATSVMGSQVSSTLESRRYDGVMGAWYGKAPGLDRAGDAIRHGNFTGASPKGGVVLFVGDDPSAKSSTVPSSSEFTLYDLMVPTVFPGTVQEIVDLGRHCVEMSRASGLWTAMKVVTAVADATGTARVGLDRVTPVVPDRGFVPTINGQLLAPYTLEREKEVMGIRMEIARDYGVANQLNRVTVAGRDPWIGVAAPGHTYQQMREALRILGIADDEVADLGIRLMRIDLLHPIDRRQIREFARGLETIVVVEDKRPFIEMQFRDALYGTADAPAVIGKVDREERPLIPGTSTLDADLIAGALHRVLRERLPEERIRKPQPRDEVIPLIVESPRTPWFCSGCPHNTSLQVPKGTMVGGGIGCHTMIVLMEPEQVGEFIGLTCMGNEGAQWIGIAPFVEHPHMVQNLGDGTYAHSGQLAIQAAIAAGVNITYKILYNDVVAMTGGQDAVGSPTVEAMAKDLLATGVKKVVITTEDRHRYRGVRFPKGIEVRDRSRIIETQEELAKIPGTTVLIHDQRCAAENRRDRKRGKMETPPWRVVINERVCEGCGDCGEKSNCLSVEPIDTEFGRKTAIHQGSCNYDASCLRGDCPSFTTVVARGDAPERPSMLVEKLAADASPEPQREHVGETVTVRMPGIGGTGVVTVSQVMGMAGKLDGLIASGLDQTGLSQKAGPVVSDLHFDRFPVDGDNKIPDGYVDVYLAFDMLVGVQPEQLEGLDARRTVVVASTSTTPTGHNIRHPEEPLPSPDAMRRALDERSLRERNVYLDAELLTERIFGDPTFSNILLMGAAYQTGALPLTAQSIEQAIQLNGVEAERNTQAFRWGRYLVSDRAKAMGALARVHAPSMPSARARRMLNGLGENAELGRELGRRVDDLIAYQNANYAREYVRFLKRVANVEQAAKPGSTALTQAVGFYLHKLMAYKDEYEVARLHLLPESRVAAEKVAGPGARVTWHLHPPMLRAIGMQQKIKLGPWFTPAMKALREAKRVRGTPLDVFGRTKVRRVERELIAEYREVIERLLARLDADNIARATAIAALPDLVRGYEEIKLRNVRKYREALREALARYEVAPS